MRLTNLDHGAVLHVAHNAIDREEIYALIGERNPFLVMNAAMAQRNFSWLAWHDDQPVAVFGGSEALKGIWQMYLFATPLFPKVALGLTRFAKREVVPRLFGEIGAHRLQADLHEKHVYAHRWLETLGAKRESVRAGYAPDGADYFHYVLRPVC